MEAIASRCLHSLVQAGVKGLDAGTSSIFRGACVLQVSWGILEVPRQQGGRTMEKLQNLQGSKVESLQVTRKPGVEVGDC